MDIELVGEGWGGTLDTQTEERLCYTEQCDICRLSNERGTFGHSENE